MNIDYEDQLHQDFLFLLDMCKDPEKAFPPKSAEANLAKQWIDHLCTYVSENLNDRRLKNIYMSHLCAALNDGKLKGPFVKEPTGSKLEKVDFEAVPVCVSSADQLGIISSNMQPLCNSQIFPSYKQNDSNMTKNTALNYPSLITVDFTNSLNSTGYECQDQIYVDSTNLACNTINGYTTLPYPCFCPPQPCQCGREGNRCTCNRATAGADSLTSHRHLKEDVICNYLMNDLKVSPEFLNDFNTSLTSFMNLCKVSSVEGRTQLSENAQNQSHPRHQLLPKNQSSLIETKATCSNFLNSSIDQIPSTSSSPDYEEMLKYIKELLEAISAELRGDIEPGSNDYLERELSRYRSFIMDHSNLATFYRTQTAGMKLRNNLLLDLQNDLVKLLNDDFS